MQTENPAPSRAKASRRNYLIDRAFQLKYTLIMVVVGAAISLLFGAMMYQAHVEATQLMDLPELYRNEVASQDSTMLWLVLAIAGTMAVALGLFGILVTHRVAGPIFVFSHYMSVLGQGRYPKLRPLRKGDELQGFYDVFHGAVEAMRARDRADGEELEKLAATLEKAASQSPQLAGSLQPLADQAREMARRLLEASVSEDPATPGQKAEAAQQTAA